MQGGLSTLEYLGNSGEGSSVEDNYNDCDQVGKADWGSEYQING